MLNAPEVQASVLLGAQKAADHGRVLSCFTRKTPEDITLVSTPLATTYRLIVDIGSDHDHRNSSL